MAIADPADSRLALYRDLNDPAVLAARETARHVVVVEGRVTVGRLLQTAIEIDSLLVDDHQLVSAAELVAAVRARGAPVFVGTRAVVAATVGFAMHRGVVAVARRPPLADPHQVLAQAVRRPSAAGGRPLVVALEGLSDFENVGSVFRNAAAFGAAAVLLDPTCADPLSRRSVRVSVGHALHVPFARLSPWPGSLDDVRAAGFVVAALVPRSEHRGAGAVPSLTLAHVSDWVAATTTAAATGTVTGPPNTVTGAAARAAVPGPVGRPLALVLGAEGPGLSAAVLAAADVLVSIPMSEGVDSLNVATAAAVALHALGGAL